MQTEIVTTDNLMPQSGSYANEDPNAQTMPVDLAIVDESLALAKPLPQQKPTVGIVIDNSLATESVDLPAISKSIDLDTLDLETFRLSFPSTDSIGIDDKLLTESAANWKSIQAQLSTSLENAKSYLTAFYKTDRQILTTLGIIFLAIIGIKVLLAGLSAIDSIPLFPILLQVVGLFYVGRFIWRYLIRERDRQELIEILDRTKVEVFGSQN